MDPSRAVAAGKGVFLLSTHTGKLGSDGRFRMPKNSKGLCTRQKSRRASTHKFVTSIRQRYGLHTEERKAKGDSFRLIVKTINDGNIVGFMQDQARPGSPRMKIIGVEAKTNVSMAEIYRRFSAPCLESHAECPSHVIII